MIVSPIQKKGPFDEIQVENCRRQIYWSLFLDFMFDCFKSNPVWIATFLILCSNFQILEMTVVAFFFILCLTVRVWRPLTGEELSQADTTNILQFQQSHHYHSVSITGFAQRIGWKLGQSEPFTSQQHFYNLREVIRNVQMGIMTFFIMTWQKCFHLSHARQPLHKHDYDDHDDDDARNIGCYFTNLLCNRYTNILQIWMENLDKIGRKNNPLLSSCFLRYFHGKQFEKHQ